MKKHSVSYKKQISIQSTDLLNRTIKGKYFSIRKPDPSNYISLIRISFKSDYYANIISEIANLPYSLTNLLSSKVKKTVSELVSQHLVFIDLESELNWARNIINKNSDAINRFIPLSKLFSTKLVSGQYEEAKDILIEIENIFGMSLWLIKNKIALIQLTEGLEVQKKYSQSLKNDLKNGSLIRFIIHWVSIRNEHQTSVSKFTNQIESVLSKLNPKSQLGFKEYCKYHILADNNLDLDEVIQVLRLEYSCSLIDYYEAYINVLNNIAFCDNESFKTKLTAILLHDKLFVVDSRIDHLRCLTHITSPIFNAEEPTILAFNSFLAGDYMTSISLSDKFLNQLPCDPILIFINAFAKAMLIDEPSKKTSSSSDPQTLLSIFINNLTALIKNGVVASSKNLNEISKLSLNFSSLPWTSAFNLFIYKDNLFTTSNDSFAPNVASKCIQIHPILIDLYSNDVSDQYLNLCTKRFGNNSTNNYYKSLVHQECLTDTNTYSCFQLHLLNSLICLKKYCYDEAIQHSQPLLNSPNGYFRRRGYGIITRAYIGKNELVLACKYIADCLIKNRAFYPYLPLILIIDIIKTGSKEWNLVNEFVDLSIIFDACVKYVDSKFENQRRFAYEDFLNKNGANKPSDLYSQINKFDKGKIIYYLRHICIESTMDTSDAFENGSQEVIEERLSICRILAEIDRENEDIYKVEINELLRRQVIASRRKEIDQSRIYIDILSVKEEAAIEVKENFERYKTYIQYGLDIDSKSNLSKATILQNNINLNTPDNEVNSLLISMIEDIREFYLSPEIGLDRFISTRIRHGDLERSLRSPIQNHNLITKRESKNGNYLRNDFWLDKIRGNTQILKYYDRILTEFSESFDRLILTLKNEYLQIKRDSKPNGYFDFTIYDISDIAKSINNDTTVHDFIDLVIRAFDSCLIVCLVNIREMLNTDAKSQAKNILNKLQEATQLNYCPILTEIQSEINQARTDMQVQFDKVIDWFVPSSSSDSTPFIIEDAIVVAEAIIKEENPLFHVSIESDEESNFSIHGHLPIFVDVFTNIFENVVKRSGIDSPYAIVQLYSNTLMDKLTIIHIKIINELGNNIDLLRLDSDLKRKKSLLDSDSYTQFLAKEGNSGFFKIHKSIMDFNLSEYNIKPTMDFGVENNKFQISLSLPFRIIVLGSEDQDVKI